MLPRFGESQMPLPGLDGSPFEAYQEKVFESWIRYHGEEVEVQGRLRLSDDLNEARIFYVDVKGSPLRIDVEFRDFSTILIRLSLWYPHSPPR